MHIEFVNMCVVLIHFECVNICVVLIHFECVNMCVVTAHNGHNRQVWMCGNTCYAHTKRMCHCTFM